MVVLSVNLPRLMGYAPGIVGLIGIIAYPFIFKKKPGASKSLLLVCIFIPAFAALSSFWALDPAFALERAIKIALVLVPGALLFSVLRSMPEELIRKGSVILPIALCAAFGLLAFESLTDMPIHRLLRGIPMDEPLDGFHLNRGAVVTSVLFFAALGLVQQSSFDEMKRNIFAILLIALLAAVQVLTDSQSANLAFLLGLILLVFFPYKHRIVWIVLGGLIMLCLAATPLIAMKLYETFAPVTSEITWLREGYASARFEIWDFVSRYALQNPFYGFGIEATRAVEQFDTTMTFFHSDTVLHPHNFSIQLWIEFGMLGILLTCGFFGFLLFKMQKLSVPSARVALPTFIACLSIAATGYGFWQGWWLGTIMTALCWWGIADRIITIRNPASDDT